MYFHYIIVIQIKLKKAVGPWMQRKQGDKWRKEQQNQIYYGYFLVQNSHRKGKRAVKTVLPALKSFSPTPYRLQLCKHRMANQNNRFYIPNNWKLKNWILQAKFIQQWKMKALYNDDFIAHRRAVHYINSLCRFTSIYWKTIWRTYL